MSLRSTDYYRKELQQTNDRYCELCILIGHYQKQYDKCEDDDTEADRRLEELLIERRADRDKLSWRRNELNVIIDHIDEKYKATNDVQEENRQADCILDTEIILAELPKAIMKELERYNNVANHPEGH